MKKTGLLDAQNVGNMCIMWCMWILRGGGHLHRWILACAMMVLGVRANISVKRTQRIASVSAGIVQIKLEAGGESDG